MKKYFYLIIVIIVELTGCTEKNISKNSATSGTYYTCPMHPSVVSDNPGSCPVCNMSLVIVNKKSLSNEILDGNFITIDNYGQILAGVKLDTIKYGNILNNDFLNGIAVQDDENTVSISSRFSGRIEKLFVNSEGMFIEKGKPMFSLYSEKIIAMQKELLELIKYREAGKSQSMLSIEMIEAARNNLLTNGLSNQIINEIISSRNIIKYITFYAENSGYISNLSASENMYIEEGQMLFTINSSDFLWVEAKLYENINKGFMNYRNFNIVSESNPQKIYKGSLIISEPLIENGNRFSLLKIRISNNEHKLVQGIQVKIFAEKPEKEVLILPKSAIIYGKTKTIWKLAHKNTFEQKTITTGIEDTGNAEIISGLNFGDVIVSEGSYLVNSEYLLKK